MDSFSLLCRTMLSSFYIGQKLSFRNADCAAMRLLILYLTLILAGLSLATAESVNVGGYNVSFNMTRPHEIVPSSGTMNAVLTIKTFDGPASIFIRPEEDEFFAMHIAFNESSKGNVAIERMKIDNRWGYVTMTAEKDNMIGHRNYGAYYSPDNHTLAIISSEMPLFDTVDFLRGLHIKRAELSRIP
jgi:hypothetical protein